MISKYITNPTLKSAVKVVEYSTAAVATVVALGLAVHAYNTRPKEEPLPIYGGELQEIITSADMSGLELITQEGELCSERLAKRESEIKRFHTESNNFAEKYGISVSKLHQYQATVQGETGTNPDKVSPVGATGFAQLMPKTYNDDLGRVINRLMAQDILPRNYVFDHTFEEYANDVVLQTEAGFLVFLEQFNSPDEFSTALAKHNAGSGNVNNAQNKAKKAGKKNNKSFCVYLPHLPMPETTGTYVKKVKEHLKNIKAKGFLTYVLELEQTRTIVNSEKRAFGLMKSDKKHKPNYQQALYHWINIEGVQQSRSKYARARAQLQIAKCYDKMGLSDLALTAYNKTKEHDLAPFYKIAVNRINEINRIKNTKHIACN